jgi:hypothetical protein
MTKALLQLVAGKAVDHKITLKPSYDFLIKLGMTKEKAAKALGLHR